MRCSAEAYPVSAFREGRPASRSNQCRLKAFLAADRRMRDMKALCAITIIGLSLAGAMSPLSAQPYGGRDYGYGDRDRGYGDRDRGYDDRGYGDRDRGYRDRGSAFDEREYLRCNPDVRRAVASGQMESGAAHYRTFGRREGRRLSC